MQAFNYRKVLSAADAIAARSNERMRFLAGGTTLLDLMKLDVETPRTVVDVTALPFARIEKTADGGVRVGALVRNSELAHDETIAKNYAALSEALLAGASAQLRNKATTAGNVLQRTRCVHFRDPAKPCNKREPGTGCSAIGGSNRNLAILGTSEYCIASNPSDMNVAMAAFEATVQVEGARGAREVPFADFHLLPGKTPERETALEPGDLITSVTLPSLPPGTRSMYLKLRDRASYEFALASIALVWTPALGGKFSRVRIAMGGIGAKPWRSLEAERILESAAARPTTSSARRWMRSSRARGRNRRTDSKWN